MAKHQQAADLAVKGWTYSEIAAELGYTNPASARYAVNAHFKRAATEAAEHLRPRYTARAELLWRHAVTVMLEGVAGGDLDRFEKGHRAAEKALGRLMMLGGFTGPNVTVNQVSMGAEASSSLDELKAEFLRLMEKGQAIEGQVVEVADTP
ncbi:hypothetical protein [Nocardia farcinica]|uniref:hypothetical protein n=1 Tax=Nocardia farcinica TaxID=37329 RepID=UPI002456F69C|nr:hypothetical protein [Nocardia farcinica]